MTRVSGSLSHWAVRVGGRNPCAWIAEIGCADVPGQRLHAGSDRCPRLPAPRHKRPDPQGRRVHDRALHEIGRQRGCLALRRVHHGTAQPAHMVEETRSGHPAVVDMFKTCAAVARERPGVPVPRSPTRGIRVDQQDSLARRKSSGVVADRDGVQLVRADQTAVQRLRGQIVALYPTNSEIEATVGDPRGLRV
jgi:hypothetical protein